MVTRALALAFLILTCSVCHATDDPASPDYVAQFEERAKPYDKAIEDATTNPEFRKAFKEYETFLSSEMNQALQALQTQLKGDEKIALEASQAAWAKYRDAEFAFISTTWTRESFGAEAFISAGAYRTSILHSRVVQLLGYRRDQGQE